MLIRPIISESKNIGTISSLPVKTPRNSIVGSFQHMYSGAYADNESLEFLEITGRLLIMPIISHERQLTIDKHNHIGEWLSCTSHHWSICTCNYAKKIRELDLEFPLIVTKELDIWNPLPDR